MTPSITKKESIAAWGEGYVETWCGFDRSYAPDIQAFCKRELGAGKNKVTLEVGSGGGYWTKFLAENSAHVHCLDVIPQPRSVVGVSWHQRNDGQFNCDGIAGECIDFVFSFGVFCHFNIEDNETYLRDIYRVLKPGGSAILMYGDTTKNPNAGFPINNFFQTMEMVGKTPFLATSLLEYRDTLLLLKKPN